MVIEVMEEAVDPSSMVLVVKRRPRFFGDTQTARSCDSVTQL
jgi:hypothetical protein